MRRTLPFQTTSHGRESVLTFDPTLLRSLRKPLANPLPSGVCPLVLSFSRSRDSPLRRHRAQHGAAITSMRQ